MAYLLSWPGPVTKLASRSCGTCFIYHGFIAAHRGKKEKQKLCVTICKTVIGFLKQMCVFLRIMYAFREGLQ